MTNQFDKCEVFARLHQSDAAWVIPNPWDVGSAKILQGLGYAALATTSSGFAFTLGRFDGSVTLQEKLDHCHQLCEQISIPINADFENGFADDISSMRDNISALIETGVAGFSIEDFSRDQKTLYEIEQSAERVQAAAKCIKDSGVPVLLTARAENLIRGVDDLQDTIDRLQAYSSAGADVLYAPGIKTLDQLTLVCSEIDKPFNVLAPFLRGATIGELSSAGAKRISTGGSLCWAAVNPLLAAGKEMTENGTFDWVSSIANGKDVKSLLDDS